MACKEFNPLAEESSGDHARRLQTEDDNEDSES